MHDWEKPLPKRTLKWFGKAIAGMIAADGVVDEKELEFLRHTLVHFLQNEREAEELVDMVRKRERPQLSQFREGDRHISFRLFYNLIKVSLQDDRLMKDEAEYLKYAGGKLGFKPDFCKKMLVWAAKEADQRRVLDDLEDLALVEQAEYT